MYLNELLTPEVTAARLPYWPDGVYVAFNWINGKLHPVCELRDPFTTKPREFLCTQFFASTGEDWVAYDRPARRDNTGSAARDPFDPYNVSSLA